MNVDWFIWRPILKKLTTLEEIRRSWTLVDLVDAHEVLDIQEDAEAFTARSLNPKG